MVMNVSLGSLAHLDTFLYEPHILKDHKYYCYYQIKLANVCVALQGFYKHYIFDSQSDSVK